MDRRRFMHVTGAGLILSLLPGKLRAQSGNTIVTNIRAAHRTDVTPSFDRVVVDMLLPVPQEVWWQYVAKLIAGGSGLEVPIEGATKYQISLIGAQAHDESGRSTLLRREITPRFPLVRQVKVFSDFEGQVLVGIGLSRETRTRTLLLHHIELNSVRAVVDFYH